MVEGVQRAQQQLPDLVICDVMMPEMDGFGVLTTSARPCDSDYSLHFITAASKSFVKVWIWEHDYLIKPSTAEELLGAIAARLKNRQPLGSGSRHSPRAFQSHRC